MQQLRSSESFAQTKPDEGYCYVVRGDPEPGFDAVAEARGKTPAIILPGYVSENQLRVDPLNPDQIADGMRLLADMGQGERKARLSGPPPRRTGAAR
jgi:hypothetical protein